MASSKRSLVQPVKALTIQQPWAQCIALGAKTVENRTRPFHHRGPLAIHAGRTWSQHGGHNDLVIRTLLGPSGRLPITQRQAASRLGVVFGHVIAVADLVDCHADKGCCRPWGEPGVFHLVLARVRRLDQTVPARGALGLWSIRLPECRR